MAAKKTNRFTVRDMGTILSDNREDSDFYLQLDKDKLLSIGFSRDDPFIENIDEEQAEALCAAILAIFEDA